MLWQLFSDSVGLWCIGFVIQGKLKKSELNTTTRTSDQRGSWTRLRLSTSEQTRRRPSPVNNGWTKIKEMELFLESYFLLIDEGSSNFPLKVHSLLPLKLLSTCIFFNPKKRWTSSVGCLRWYIIWWCVHKDLLMNKIKTRNTAHYNENLCVYMSILNYWRIETLDVFKMMNCNMFLPLLLFWTARILYVIYRGRCCCHTCKCFF